jgi:hypothetical protein
LAGKIVLSIGSTRQSDAELFERLSDTEANQLRARLAQLHRHKIDLADEILVINPGGYIGESTRAEIDYALQQNKRIRYLEPANQ